MRPLLDRITSGGKSVLCIVLMLHMHLALAGCGPGVSLLGGHTLPLDEALNGVLAGSTVAGATGVNVNPLTKTFRLVYPDGNTSVSGSYTTVDGEPLVTQIVFFNGTNRVAVELNAALQITDLSTSQGATWSRAPSAAVPSAPTFPRAPSARASAADVNAYLAANADLMAIAQQMDQAGLTADDFAGKDGSSFVWAAAALASIVLVPASIAANVLFVIQVVALVRLVLG